ncbi:YceD family protein [Sulfitobacter aestuariivivens]|uniref:YceD family protein n=1 Tax=Sulfitobacter aestuariivivens TaxID=2766981 RepID=UPI003608FA70
MRVADLKQNAEKTFSVRPDAAALSQIAGDLALSALRKVRFEGRLKPLGRTDWTLEAQLGATVVQPCVVTLDPVTTRIDTPVVRHFVQDFVLSDDPETEMPDDDTTESLGPWIDPAEVMKEALALAVPDYPRKDAAALGQMVYAEPGTAPMTDEDAKPFAGLANLKDQLIKPKE